MKKVTYFMILMFALVTVFTSCEKSDDDPLTPIVKTSGELYPAYVGVWQNDSTYSNGEFDDYTAQYGFEFENVKAYLFSVLTGEKSYDGWVISNSTLTLESIDYGNRDFTIVLASSNKLVLEITDCNNNIMTYYLSK